MNREYFALTQATCISASQHTLRKAINAYNTHVRLEIRKLQCRGIDLLSLREAQNHGYQVLCSNH